MNLFVSNLIAGLDKGLEHPEFLLEMTAPFHGLVGIEFFIHTYSKAYMNQLEHIEEWTNGLPLAFHGPFVTVEASSVPGNREYCWLMESYEKAFQLVKEFGGSHVVFHDHECFVKPEKKKKLQKQSFENMKRLEEMAAKWGLRLFLENLALPSKGTPLFEQDEYIELFEQFPRSDCLIDIGHLGVAGWDMEHVISALKGRIKAYHLHNNDGKADSHCRIGEGVISYEYFFDLYCNYTPEADLTLEYGDNHRITPEQVIADLRYVWEKIKGGKN